MRPRGCGSADRLDQVKILILGSGAREHALTRCLGQDPAVTALHALPGNPGIGSVVSTAGMPTVLHSGNPLDPAGVTALAVELGVDLVVIGPEGPLVAGVGDALRSAGIAVFGPDAAAAKLEGSKAFAKEVMAASGVPTAKSLVCSTPADLNDAFDEFGAPYVVKDDGLAAGKGVVVTDHRKEAFAHGLSVIEGGGVVVVEDYLDGPEVSLFCLCDGKTVVPLQPAQDFKRAFDHDAGPNTGGMGSYTPLPWAPASLADDVVALVAQPTIDEMARRGMPFTGVLYCGLALTPEGTRVIEFNVRFGDPETQGVLAQLRTPLAGVLLAAAQGRLADIPPLEWAEGAAVTVVIAAKNYPLAPKTGDPIGGLAEVEEEPNVHVLHAATAFNDSGVLVSAGGRVLSVVGHGPSLAFARERAYRGVDYITLDSSHHRKDIAKAVADAEQA